MTGSVRFFFRWVFLGVILRLLHLKQYERFLPEKKARFFIHPGWHQLLPDGWFILIDTGLVVSILANLMRPSKTRMAFVTFFIFADYVTFPGRMMNHYTLLLFVLGIHWVWFLFSADSIVDNSLLRRSLFSLMGMGFFCAAVHKLNDGYLDVEATSNVCVKIIDKLAWIFQWKFSPPHWLLTGMAIFSIVFELAVLPLVLIGFSKFPKWIALSCLLFVFVLVLLKSVPDYTWVAACFVPLLFSDSDWAIIAKNLFRPSLRLMISVGSCLSLIFIFLSYLGIKVFLFIPVGIIFGVLINGVGTYASNFAPVSRKDMSHAIS